MGAQPGTKMRMQTPQKSVSRHVAGVGGRVGADGPRPDRRWEAQVPAGFSEMSGSERPLLVETQIIWRP